MSEIKGTTLLLNNKIYYDTKIPIEVNCDCKKQQSCPACQSTGRTMINVTFKEFESLLNVKLKEVG